MKIYDNEQVNNLLQKHFKDKAKNGGLSRKNKSKRK